MKSTVSGYGSFDVFGHRNQPKPSIHAGSYGVSMFDHKASMCARVRVCAHEFIVTTETS